MGLIVQKFGGSSVKDRDRIFNEQMAKTGVTYFDYYLLHDVVQSLSWLHLLSVQPTVDLRHGRVDPSQHCVHRRALDLKLVKLCSVPADSLTERPNVGCKLLVVCFQLANAIFYVVHTVSVQCLNGNRGRERSRPPAPLRKAGTAAKLS